MLTACAPSAQSVRRPATRPITIPSVNSQSLRDAATPAHDASADASTPTPATTPTTASTTASAPTPAIELTFVGDVMFGRYRDDGFHPIAPNDYPLFASVREQLRSDLAIANLETPVVRTLPLLSPVQTHNRFGASPEHARQLQSAGITAVTLANNHSLDQRSVGSIETPVILRELSIHPLGASLLRGPHVRVESLQIRTLSVGFVAVTCKLNLPRVVGEPMPPYLDPTELSAHVAPLLRHARSSHDLLVVMVHWGDELSPSPSAPQVRAAHELIDAGADMLIGHHPHVLQRVELYHSKIIAYSLGNFLFDNEHHHQRETAVLRLRAHSHCIESATLHPVFIERDPFAHPVAGTGETGLRIRAQLRRLFGPQSPEWIELGEDLVLRANRCS